MLTGNEFMEWCQKNQVSELGVQKIVAIRSGQPQRKPISRISNGTGRYPSRKMKRTIGYESRTVELAALHWMDNDDTYLEFYEQPTTMKLDYLSKQGRHIAAQHTVDIFALRHDGAGWEEWKVEEELKRLAEKQPNRYQRDKYGHWRCPPGETWAKKYGFTYRVRSSAELNPIYDRNLLYLDDFLRETEPKLADTTAPILDEVFNKEMVVTVEQLRTILPSREIFLAIILGVVYADLRVAPLADGKYAFLYRSKSVAEGYQIIASTPYQPFPQTRSNIKLGVGVGVVWDGRTWTMYNDGETVISLYSPQGSGVHVLREEFFRLIECGNIVQAETQSITPALGMTDTSKQQLNTASPKDYTTANTHYALLKRFWAGEKPEEIGIPLRTLQSWNKRWREAEKISGLGYIGLLPLYIYSGNPNRKLSEDALSALADFLEKYQQAKQPNKASIWGQMDNFCRERGIDTPSYKTFLQEIKRVPIQKRTLAREGKRAAYQYKKQNTILDHPFMHYGTPRHGERPFEIGHIDHFLIDIELRCSKTGINLGKPWATVLIDAFSRRILAVYLTFDDCSYRSDMMVLRECVRRHNRLPQIIVVDNGSDFGSVYFETLLAIYEIDKRERPTAEPRFGSVIERYFGTTNSEFVHNVQGNTKASKNPRQMTSAVNPKNLAIWTLEGFYRRLCEYCYTIYDQNEHGGIFEAPRSAFERGMIECGVRPFRHISYDEAFIMLTLPTTSRGTAKVNNINGVKVHYEWYWSDAFRQQVTETAGRQNDVPDKLPTTAILNIDVAGCNVPVRYDPFDISRVFAWVNGKWHLCLAAHYIALRHHTERELQLITAELHKRRALHSQNRPLSISRIAAFLTSLESEEITGIQRSCDSESRTILGFIDASYSFPLFQSEPTLYSEQVQETHPIVVADLDPYGEY